MAVYGAPPPVYNRTPEESAMRIIEAFIKKFGERPNVGMVKNEFKTSFVVPGWTLEDFERGMALALNKEWIITTLANMKLTQEGLDAYLQYKSSNPA